VQHSRRPRHANAVAEGANSGARSSALTSALTMTLIDRTRATETVRVLRENARDAVEDAGEGLAEMDGGVDGRVMADRCRWMG